MEKMAWDGPKWCQEGLFSANQDLADILGDMDFDFEHFHFEILLDSTFWMSRFPDYQNPGRAWAPARLGPGLDRCLRVNRRYLKDHWDKMAIPPL